MRSAMRHAVTILLIFLAAMIVLRLARGGAAPVPDAFADSLPLSQAIERAAAEGKPVLVLATADWCMPCQYLKRTALRDERVAKAIAAKTVPVYLDVTDTNDETVQRHVQAMKVGDIPAMILLRGGEEIGRIEGDVPAARLLSWLNEL